MTVSALENYMATWMEKIRAAFPTKEICHNSLWNAGGAQQFNNPNVIRQIKVGLCLRIKQYSILDPFRLPIALTWNAVSGTAISKAEVRS